MIDKERIIDFGEDQDSGSILTIDFPEIKARGCLKTCLNDTFNLTDDLNLFKSGIKI